jgi:alpha-D-ribose 1-methylphosphonate 5-phosphate C-P lyase
MFDLYTDQEEVDFAHDHVFEVVSINQCCSLLTGCDLLGFIVLEFDM